jgi:hypothetical protein
MIIKTLKLFLPLAFGLFFIQFGLNWGKDDLFNESNVEELLKSGIKTHAYIMGDFKKRIYLTPKMGNVHYYFQLDKFLYSGDGIDSVSMKNITEVIYLAERPSVNCINSKVNIDQILKSRFTAKHNYYFVIIGILFLCFSFRLFWK